MKFYKLQKEMSYYLIEQLENHSQWKVWCYLTTFDPFGDKYIELPPLIDVLMICNISERTFYRAIAKLKELELFDFKYDRAYIRNLATIHNRTIITSDDSQNVMARLGSPTVTDDSPTVMTRLGSPTVMARLGSPTVTGDSQNDTDDSPTIYTDFKTSLSEYSESEGEKIFKGNTHIHTETQPESLAGETEILNGSPVNPKSLGEEKFSAAAEISEISRNAGSQISTVATVAIAAPPTKPIPKPKAPGSPKITDWLLEGPWKIDGGLDVNFRDWLAQSWVKEYGGDIHKRKADVLSHFKKDPANLPIRWEQYTNEFFHRYQTAQILLNNGVEIKPEYQETLIANQRAITAELPPEISPLALNPTPEIQSTPLLAEKTLSSSPVEIPQETKMSNNRQALTTLDHPESIKTEDGRVLNYWKPPVIKERPITPEQSAEIQEKIAKLGGKFSFGKSPSRDETPCNPVEVVESTEEAIALEETAKEDAYLGELNVWIKDPILCSEAMKAVLNSSKYECVFDEEREPCQVIRTEPKSFFCED